MDRIGRLPTGASFKPLWALHRMLRGGIPPIWEQGSNVEWCDGIQAEIADPRVRLDFTKILALTAAGLNRESYDNSGNRPIDVAPPRRFLAMGPSVDMPT